MLLSIVTPTLNRLNFLKKKLKQIKLIRKNFYEFEWILVVEKKDKSTIKYLKRNKEKYIKVLIGDFGSAENAFNSGVLKAKGKYVNFHGDDDFFNMKKYKFLKKDLFLKKYEWIIFNGNYINENFFIIRKFITTIKNFLLNNFGLVDLTYVNYIMTPSVFIRKDTCLKFGSLGKFKQAGSDYFLWMKLNNKHKPKIYKQNLTLSMITNKTITGNFDLNKYIIISKKMIANNKFGLLGKFLIITSTLIIIVYNFIFKKIIN
jgi:hypothetical protein